MSDDDRSDFDLDTRVRFDLYGGLECDLAAEPTNLYFVGGLQWVKVGLAQDVRARLPNLQCGCPFKLTILHHIPIPRAFSRQVERHTHQRLKAFAAHGEWFDVDVETAIAAATDVIRQSLALSRIMVPVDDGWGYAEQPRISGADFIYLMGGRDFGEKRMLLQAA